MCGNEIGSGRNFSSCSCLPSRHPYPPPHYASRRFRIQAPLYWQRTGCRREENDSPSFKRGLEVSCVTKKRSLVKKKTHAFQGILCLTVYWTRKPTSRMTRTTRTRAPRPKVSRGLPFSSPIHTTTSPMMDPTQIKRTSPPRMSLS